MATRLDGLQRARSGSVAAFLIQNLILYDMADLPCDRFYAISLAHFAGSVGFVASGGLPWVLAATAVGCVIWDALWVVITFRALGSKLEIGMFTRMSEVKISDI